MDKPKRLLKQDFVTQVAHQSGFTKTQVQVLFDSIVAAVADQFSKDVVEINVAGLVRVQRVYRPPKPERKFMTKAGKVLVHKPKPGKYVIRMKPTTQFKQIIEGIPKKEI